MIARRSRCRLATMDAGSSSTEGSARRKMVSVATSEACSALACAGVEEDEDGLQQTYGCSDRKCDNCSRECKSKESEMIEYACAHQTKLAV